MGDMDAVEEPDPQSEPLIPIDTSSEAGAV
jgi:hypothetical protein